MNWIDVVDAALLSLAQCAWFNGRDVKIAKAVAAQLRETNRFIVQTPAGMSTRRMRDQRTLAPNIKLGATRSHMSPVESFFLRTLDDLSSRAMSQDDYTVLGASALIRKLLIDGQPLVDQVNQMYRLKLTYEISDSSPNISGVPDPTFWSVQDGLDPETSRPGKPKKSASRDQLLSTVVAVIEGKSYTLRDVVLFEANVMGGVHAGSAKEEKEQVLKALDDELAIGGYRSSLRQLQAISRVVLKGLEPLRQAVVAASGA